MTTATTARRGPSMYVILFAVLAIVITATWIVPAGRFATVRYDSASKTLVAERGDEKRVLPPTQGALASLGVRSPIADLTDGTTTKPIAIPGTYRAIAASPQSPLAMLTAPIAGAIDGADIFMFILVIGGFIGVFARSGAFDAGIAALTARLAGREYWLIVILTLLFGLGGTTEGMAEETLAFYPLLVPAFLAAGYDRIVPLAVILGGSQFGCLASTVNPFSTIIASATIGARWTDGIGVRAGMWVAVMALLIGWTLRYAARVRRDPALSLAGHGDVPAEAEVEAGRPARPIDGRILVQLALFLGSFVVMIVGVSRLGWWFGEMSALFLGASVASGLLQSGDGRIDAFIAGARDLLGVAIVIALARAITVVLSAGHIDGTIIQSASVALAGVPHGAFLIGCLAFFVALSLVTQSSSSAAVLTMPLLGPLAAGLGVGGAGVVTAYLFGMNLLGTLAPAGMVLPSLAIAGVGYKAWARFSLPLIGVVGILSVLVLAFVG